MWCLRKHFGHRGWYWFRLFKHGITWLVKHSFRFSWCNVSSMTIICDLDALFEVGCFINSSNHLFARYHWPRYPRRNTMVVCSNDAVLAEISLRSPRIFFVDQINYLQDQSIQKFINLILKKTSLVCSLLEVTTGPFEQGVSKPSPWTCLCWFHSCKSCPVLHRMELHWLMLFV